VLLNWVESRGRDRYDDICWTSSYRFFGHTTITISWNLIHLIRHSRGASLNTIGARSREQRVLVDQVTSLDPHPVETAGT
jgi:hypothetical protein